jgi:hypothetical protein
MSEAESLFAPLRQAVGAEAAGTLERLVREGEDHELNRISALDFAARSGLGEEAAIAAFLHAARLGLFEMSWNVLCPGCGGVLGASATLKSVDRAEYNCALCAAGYEPTLDEMVEVTFTVSPRVRRIAAHDPNALPMAEYARQVFWSSGVDLPENFAALIEEITLDAVELPPGEKAILSLQAPAEFLIVFDPVTHATQFLDVQGEPTRERQNLAFTIDKAHTPNETVALRPGPLRLAIDNRTDTRALPAVWIAGDKLHDLLGRRKPFLTAKRLLTNQSFRDLYRTDTLDVDQRLKITSLTFLFTDEAMRRLNVERGREDLLKIGIHEGPCLAVTLNERQDYFGQTVNIASRVQGLAGSQAIFATGAVVEHPPATKLLAETGMKPLAQRRALRGVADELTLYEIP